ncbi:hypothetical protein K7432_003719 [Basidiobolus ranarum]|uniref:Uncharacterized protein n=1 Tax=Basidiobolus ranarum TaxID=34480 RepID=A0ABR2W5S4_9FUNG
MRLIPLLSLLCVITVNGAPAYQDGNSLTHGSTQDYPATADGDTVDPYLEDGAEEGDRNAPDNGRWTKRSTYGGNYNGSRRANYSFKHSESPEVDDNNYEEAKASSSDSVEDAYDDEDVDDTEEGSYNENEGSGGDEGEDEDEDEYDS